MDWNHYIDLDTALGRVRNSKVIYRKMLGLFERSAEFEALENALAAGDWPQVDAVAHGIKGMTGNLGFNPLFEASAALMLAARQGAPDETVVAAYRKALTGTKAAVAALTAEWDAGAM